MTKKVADYFMEHGQFDKAMEILVKSKKIGEAIDLCMAHNITLTEELVERMTIPKRPNGEWYTMVGRVGYFLDCENFFVLWL